MHGVIGLTAGQPATIGITAEDLGAVAGILLSLAFSYIPDLKERYEPLDSTWKRLVMAGLLLISALVVWLLSCNGLMDAVACSRDGVVALMRVFIFSLIANQSAYMLSPKSPPGEEGA